MIGFSFETQLDPVALAALLLALAGLAWQIVTHFRSGPRLRVSVMPGATFYGAPDEERCSYVAVFASNTGDRATQITHLCGAYWRSPLRRWLRPRKADRFWFVPDTKTNAGHLHGYHVKLDPGDMWAGAFPYSDDIAEMRESGYLEVQLTDSVRRRPTRERIKPKG